MGYFQRLLVGTDRTFATIEIDAMLVEQYDLSSQITSHPVDRGANIADHVYNDPRIYTIEAVVTDTPMGVLAALQTLGDNARSALNYITSAITGEEAEAPATARSVAAFQSLVELWEAKIAINVQTGMGLWENLVIRNIRVRQDQETANHLRFTATLQQVNLTSVQIVGEENLEEGPVEESASPVKNEGLKQDISNVTEAVRSAAGRFFG